MHNSAISGSSGFSCAPALIYKNAPIVEAVIDFRTTFGEPPAFERFQALAHNLAAEFPQVQPMNEIRMAFEHDANGLTSNTSAEASGLRLTSAKGDRVLQLRKNGMSYSHGMPYTEWDIFVGGLLPIWNRFVTEFGVTQVVRSATRYINRIIVPYGMDVSEYLNLTPNLPTLLARTEGYFCQLVCPQTDLGPEWKAIVNTGIEAGSFQKPDAESAGVLLDIDLFCVAPISTDQESVVRMLDQLRLRKNQIFEACITDKVRETIR